MSCFKVPFSLKDYKDILPSMEDYLKDDFVINGEELHKGNVDNCIWQKYMPTQDEITSPQFREREARRILRTGAWIVIKDELIWLPPNYYFFLSQWNVGGVDPEFRVKRLKHVLFKLQVRAKRNALGSYTVKCRQDGETSIAMSDCMWEVAEGNMDYGAIGVQSKIRDSVIKSCWRIFTMGWNGMDSWVKNDLYGDMVSGESIAEKMKFVTQKTDTNKGRDILVTYAAGSHNAFDSMNNMRRCVLDEFNKFQECSPYATFLNYEKFIAAGSQRKGVFDIFSSPNDIKGKYDEEVYDFWKGSNPDELIDGTTSTRIFRYYSNPLEGMEGEYDKWGDADADKIYAEIMRKRKSVPKEYRMGEVRANPLNETEMFESTDNGFKVWDNHEGIKQRGIYLLGARFKSAVTKEPVRLYGNLEWENGVRDSEVVFRTADRSEFDLTEARFAISHIPQNRPALKTNSQGGLVPPLIFDNCLGIDPVDKRYVTIGAKGFSNAAMVNHHFRDTYQTGIPKMPTLLYSCRPTHVEIFFEDAIKAAVFNRAAVQTESVNSKIIDYFEDRNYIDWMLSKRGQAKSSLMKGDSPSGGKNMFLQEIMGLINGITNTPLNEGEIYNLENFWFPEMIECLLKFNPKDTHSSDISMSFGQALMGSVKIMYKKARQQHSFNNEVMNFLLT